MTNQEYLKAVIQANNLKQKEVAEMCGVKEPTVTGWLADPATKHFRAMPDRAVALLKLTLRQKRMKVRV